MVHAFGNLGICGQPCVRLPPPKASRNLREKLCLPMPSSQYTKSTCLHESLRSTVCLLRERCTLGGARRPPSVQIFVNDSVVAGAKNHSLLFLVVLRDEMPSKIGHYSGPLVLTSYCIDELYRLFGAVNRALLQCFEEHIRWQQIILSCGLRQYIGLLVL